MAPVTAALKKAKKIWVDILAPKDFGERKIGESPVYEQAQMIGKPVLVNLSQLTGDVKKQNINVGLQVVDVKENKAQTVIKNIILQSSSIRRMVRPGSTRIDESFVCVTKDGIRIRIKPLLVTRAKVKGSISASLRDNLVKEIKKAIEKSTFDQFINQLISFNLQKDLKNKLSKIYPLKTAQIKWFGYEKMAPVKKQAEEVKEAPAEEEAKKAEKPKKIKKKAVKKETGEAGKEAEEPKQETEEKPKAKKKKAHEEAEPKKEE